MLTVRYKLDTGLLTGWNSGVTPRDESEAVVELSVDKPDNDDYENFHYVDGELIPSGKLPPKPCRDLASELDALKARVEILEIVKVK